MANWETCPAVERHRHRVSGAWVFKGTRVPVSALFENLKAGASIEQFLEWLRARATSGLLTPPRGGLP